MATILLYIVIFIAAYIVVSSILHYLVFPVAYPVYSEYFQPGDLLTTYDDGMKQVISSIQGDLAFGTVFFEPNAIGPVEHIHKHFDEVAIIEEGQLSVIQDGQKVVFKKGERMNMKKGVSHKLFNETSKQVIFRTDDAVGIPASFMYSTAQLYGLFAKDPRNRKPPRVLMHIAMLGKTADIYPSAKGSVPPAVIEVLKFLLAPTARLLGYKAYYKDITPIRS